MRRRTFAVAAALVAAPLAGLHAAPVTLSALFQAQAGYSEAEIRAMTDAYMKLHPDVKVTLEFVPYEALHDKAVLAKGSSHGYDVVLGDNIWTPEFAAHGVLADVTSRITQAMRDGILPGAMGSGEYHGHVYGLPWIADAKYLFWNKAIFAKAGIAGPPRTWTEVEQDALLIKQKGLLEYPLVWSWSQNEALVCDYAVLLAANHGSFVDDAGKPAFQAGGGLKAAQFMVQTLRTDKVSNPHSLEYVEDDVKRVFSAGQAAMALNWTYMWDGANTPSNDTKVAGEVGVEPAPGFDQPGQVGTVNGSQPLGISAGSQHPDAAWDYIVYLTSPAVQDAYATNSLPVWQQSFSDPKVIAGRTALLDTARQSFAAMINRPEVVGYQQFSVALQQALQQLATGRATPAAALQSAAETLGGS